MISFDEFLKQDEADKYNMLQECNAIIQQQENIIKEVREEIKDRIERNKDISYIEITNKAYVREQEELLEILGRENNDK